MLELTFKPKGCGQIYLCLLLLLFKGYSSSFGRNSGGLVDIPVVGEASETLVVGACLTETEVGGGGKNECHEWVRGGM